MQYKTTVEMMPGLCWLQWVHMNIACLCLLQNNQSTGKLPELTGGTLVMPDLLKGLKKSVIENVWEVFLTLSMLVTQQQPFLITDGGVFGFSTEGRKPCLTVKKTTCQSNPACGWQPWELIRRPSLMQDFRSKRKREWAGRMSWQIQRLWLKFYPGVV